MLFSFSSRGLLADDDDGYGYWYGYDDDDSIFDWESIFGDLFGSDDDDDDDDDRGNDLEMCAVNQSDYGVACTRKKTGSKECKKAINKLTIAEVHHYVNECHGSMPYLFESTATTIPEIIAFYRG